MPDAWRQLKRFFEEENRQSREHDALPCPEKIFVSRRLWPDDRRAIHNIGDVEKAAADRGYTIINPEKYSVAQQAAIFSRARAIVGEDGSGLHNVIFTEPGCVLGVIGIPERTNLWHVGICELLGHRSAYIQACFDAAGQRMVRAADASDLLAAIEAHIVR
jgi:capsular polysaccharide biosynthesis protein